MFPDTVVDPSTVMIILTNACFTDRTMMFSGFHFLDASHAKMVEPRVLSILSVTMLMNLTSSVLKNQSGKEEYHSS